VEETKDLVKIKVEKVEKVEKEKNHTNDRFNNS
jgi:hypothetical protein